MISNLKQKSITGLLILDGWGYNAAYEGNAIAQAYTPNWDNLIENYPNGLINASGEQVGLPASQMGNSEVGHINIGAGRIIYQDLLKINKVIQNGGFQKNKEFIATIQDCVRHNSNLHIFGLVSDGGVHSHISHIKNLVKLVNNACNVYLHVFTDGRDVSPKSALNYLEELHRLCEFINKDNKNFQTRIATISGRYYAMDRDNRWERVEKAYQVIAYGNQYKNAVNKNFKNIITQCYVDNITDEFIAPEVLLADYSGIKDYDSIIFMNFRSDRAREISLPFIDENFKNFPNIKTKKTKLTNFVTLTEYHKEYKKKYTNKNMKIRVVFTPLTVVNNFGSWVSKHKLKQLRIAETEKYPHVTFFFNSGIEVPYSGEERILIPSPKVATYDLQPEMSIYQLRDKLLSSINSHKFDCFVCNIANPDMVGHSGKLEACIKAVESVDAVLGNILETVEKTGGELIITADHGNIETLINPKTNEPCTSHTTNQVPIVYYGKRNLKISVNGILADLAPSFLYLLNLQPPKEMTGSNLLLEK